MKFTVQPTPDFKPQQEADCSVLLKLKKGDEYKLVLNMQAYSPDKITVKLNGQELTILATGADGTGDNGDRGATGATCSALVGWTLLTT